MDPLKGAPATSVSGLTQDQAGDLHYDPVEVCRSAGVASTPQILGMLTMQLITFVLLVLPETPIISEIQP